MNSLAVSDSYQIQLEIFEGPLDLLLHLIRREEIDVYDIPIARITDQYLRFLEMMEDLNISLAGEFLVMAATLILIKTRMLLPSDPTSDVSQTEDPREELVEQLLEHEKFKSAAQMLYARETVELSVWLRGANEFEREEEELVAAGVFDLIRAFHAIVQRLKKEIVMEVRRESVTLEEKIAEVRRLLMIQPKLLFSAFFRRRLSRRHMAITLFALLELVRLGEIRLFQKGLFQDIRIVAC